MTLLALDSSTEVCSAALLQDGQVLAERCNLTGSNHAALLPTYVQELQSHIGSPSATLDAIVLSEGPGSYTGLRIGASLAKGLCYGQNIPLLAVPTLAVIAYAAIRATNTNSNHSSPSLTRVPEEEAGSGSPLFCPMIDARRMEVYCTVYDANMQVIQPLTAKIIDAQSFADLLDGHDIYFCGNGADKCRTVINHPHAHWIEAIVPTGADAGRLAYTFSSRSDLVRTITGKDIAYFEPNYLKEFVAAPSHIKGLH